MNKKYLAIGGVILAAILIYIWYKKKNATPATTLTPDNSTTVSNPVTGQSTTGYATSGGTPIPQPVIDWMNTLPSNSKQIAFAAIPQMSNTDVNQLFTVVTQYFNTGIPVKTNPTVNQYWVNYVTKFKLTNPSTGQLY